MNFLKNYKVLIVDDDATTRLAHNLLIKKLGALEVFEASSVDQALEELDSNSFNLVISDYIMPGKSGLDLYKSMILKDIHTPFAMVTANSDSDAVKEMIELGISAILVKPITKEMLLSRLAKII
ncbi:MAG: two-component system response regulator [Halobacteriovorax sp.]|nr:two-component system response regulator [Halobacteriovorax sp.]|tara:strand:+ start:150630 stop:151001 length:372 start_codon:yes stop_codon:yes gene_type:complete